MDDGKRWHGVLCPGAHQPSIKSKRAAQRGDYQALPEIGSSCLTSFASSVLTSTSMLCPSQRGMTMPPKPGRACRVSGCARLARGRSGSCRAHPRDHWRAEAAGRQRTGRTAYYGPRWRRISAAYARRHPHCEQCGTPRDVTHHIISRRDGGLDDEANLMSLCHPCHGAIHAASGEYLGGRARGRGVGVPVQ